MLDGLGAAAEGMSANAARFFQIEGGFVAGLLLGAVPFAGVGHGLLDAAGVLAHGTPEARMGLAIGQIVGGLAVTIEGLTSA